MTFEEQFPSLIWKYHNIEFPTPEGIEIRMAIKEKDIQENCLDKKKVRDAIDKIINNGPQSFVDGGRTIESSYADGYAIAIGLLKKELGL